MFFGRIISGSKLIEAPFYIEITQKFIDDGVPTLVIGKKRAIDLFGGENVHVLDKKIRENVWWTYAKNEKRVDYEDDMKNFIESVTKKLVSSVNYYFVNIFTEKYSFVKKFIRWMDSDSDKSVYITDKHIYIYGGKNVIGLSIWDLRFAGISSKKVIGRIKSNPANHIIDDDIVMDENLRKFIMNNNIIVPYIHYLSY